MKYRILEVSHSGVNYWLRQKRIFGIWITTGANYSSLESAKAGLHAEMNQKSYRKVVYEREIKKEEI